MLRIAVVDSGINPRLARIAGGVSLTGGDLDDRVGHGTAVAAAILERAPDVELYAVKIFDRTLACDLDRLVCALAWCGQNHIDIVNLSIGTADPSHAGALAEAVSQLKATVVSAYGWLPGNLDGVVAVDEDRTCPPGECRSRVIDSRRILVCSGASPEGALRGVSFAVANATGFLAAGRVTLAWLETRESRLLPHR